MATMLIYSKTLKNILLQSHLADCLKTMPHLGGYSFKIYINNDPTLILTYFKAR